MASQDFVASRERLAQLAALKAEGILTDEEYASKRAGIIDEIALEPKTHGDLDGQGRHVNWLGITIASMLVPFFGLYGIYAWIARFSWKRRAQSVLVSVVAIALVAGAGASLTRDSADSRNNQTATRQYSTPETMSEAGEAVPVRKTVEEPGHALARQALAVYRGDSELAWLELHPAQQAQIPEEWFAKCASIAGRGAPVTSITSVASAATAPSEFGLTAEEASARYPLAAQITVDGVTYETVAVMLRYTYYNGQQREFVHHAVLVDGAWRWLMIGAGLRESREGNCGVYFGAMA